MTRHYILNTQSAPASMSSQVNITDIPCSLEQGCQHGLRCTAVPYFSGAITYRCVDSELPLEPIPGLDYTSIMLAGLVFLVIAKIITHSTGRKSSTVRSETAGNEMATVTVV